MEVIHNPCPYESCGSSDAFSYNTEKMVGHCHSCDNPYPSKLKMYDWAKEAYPTKDNKKRKTNQDMIEPTDLWTKKSMAYRGITESTMKFYRCVTDIDENGKPIQHNYLYPSGKNKYRILPKEFHTEVGFRTDALYGMNLFNAGSAKAVTICEGELDAMSAFQMLGSKYPVVSLPSATPNRKLLEVCKEWLDSFEKIYLSMDNDNKAENFAISLMNLFPGRVYKVPHDKYKDANEFLQAGLGDGFRNAWYNAKLYTPENILASEEDFLGLLDESQENTYVPTGIPDLDAKILGLMQGHFTVIKAPTSVGKTQFMRHLEYNLIKNHPDIKFAVWHLEETKLRSLLGIVSYQLNDNLTRKDLIDAKGKLADVKSAIANLTKNSNYIQFSLREEEDSEEFINQIRVLTQVYGCQYIFAEPLQDIVSIADEKSKEAELASLSVRLSKLAAELNVGIITIAHTNEQGATKYCRMIEQRASVVISLSRDKFAEDLVARNTTSLLVEKNRPCGLDGPAGELFFDLDTFTLKLKSDTW